MRPKCKRVGCYNPSAKAPQVYCCRDCAPYGYYSREYQIELSAKKKQERATRAEDQKKILLECEANGMTLLEASRALGLAMNTTAVYARRWGIHLQRKRS